VWFMQWKPCWVHKGGAEQFLPRMASFTPIKVVGAARLRCEPALVHAHIATEKNCILNIGADPVRFRVVEDMDACGSTTSISYASKHTAR